MSTSYSFYKTCSSSACALSLVVLVALSGHMVLAEDCFAADGDIVAEAGEQKTDADAAKVEDKAKVEGNAEAEPEVDNRSLAEKLGIKTTSTNFLANFDPEDKHRDPFGPMEEAPTEAMPNDAWWDEAQEEQNAQDHKDLYFNGQSPVECNAAYARLPMIKVTGMLQINGRSAVTAMIQGKGSCVLYQNDRLVLNSTTGESMTKWLIVKQIQSNGMTLILDDGKEISGKFY